MLFYVIGYLGIVMLLFLKLKKHMLVFKNIGQIIFSLIKIIKQGGVKHGRWNIMQRTGLTIATREENPCFLFRGHSSPASRVKTNHLHFLGKVRSLRPLSSMIFFHTKHQAHMSAGICMIFSHVYLISDQHIRILII